MHVAFSGILQVEDQVKRTESSEANKQDKQTHGQGNEAANNKRKLLLPLKGDKVSTLGSVDGLRLRTALCALLCALHPGRCLRNHRAAMHVAKKQRRCAPAHNATENESAGWEKKGVVAQLVTRALAALAGARADSLA